MQSDGKIRIGGSCTTVTGVSRGGDGSWVEKRFARPGKVCYKRCVTSNTITVRLRRPKAEIEAAAKPNVNAWVNKLIEHALGPCGVDWNEHFDRRSSGRKFHLTGKVERRER